MSICFIYSQRYVFFISQTNNLAFFNKKQTKCYCLALWMLRKLFYHIENFRNDVLCVIKWWGIEGYVVFEVL